MDAPHNAQIIVRANQLWEEAGSPEGRTEEFYARAEEELREQEGFDPIFVSALDQQSPASLAEVMSRCSQVSAGALELVAGLLCVRIVVRYCFSQVFFERFDVGLVEDNAGWVRQLR